MGLLSDSRLALPALTAVHCVLSVLPISVRQQVAALETALASQVAGRGAVQSSAATSHMAARCLAQLPRVHQGIPEAWSSLMRRTLISLSEATDAVLLGMDDQSLASKAR